LQVLVDQDPVFDADTGFELSARLHANSYHHEVAFELAPVTGTYAVDRSDAFEGLEPGPQHHLHPVVGVVSR
jgi:hypothetical protein